jgi:hypothetical protein
MLVCVEGSKRGRLWIIVGLSMAALAAIMFALIAAARPGDVSRSASPQPSTPTVTIQETKTVEVAPTRITEFPYLPGPPIAPTATLTAQPPSTVTVTVQQPAAQPSATASSGGGFLNSTAATIGLVTTLVVAVSGLITAATGLIKVFRPERSTAGTPPK